MKTPIKDWIVLATFTLLATVSGTSEASAAEHVARWIGNADGRWFGAANWDIGRSPDNAGGEVFDVVWDTHPVNVELNTVVPVTIRNFTFSSGGTLTGAVNLIITGDLNWSGGVMRGPDSATRATIVNGESTLSAAPGQFIALVNRSLYAGVRSRLRSPLWLETRAGAAFPSRIDVGGASEFIVEPGASLKVLPRGSSGFVNVGGALRIPDSPTAFDSEASIVISGSTSVMEVGDRTVNFAPGTGNSSQITPTMLNELNAAWNAVASYASPALQRH